MKIEMSKRRKRVIVISAVLILAVILIGVYLVKFPNSAIAELFDDDVDGEFEFNYELTSIYVDYVNLVSHHDYLTKSWYVYTDEDYNFGWENNAQKTIDIKVYSEEHNPLSEKVLEKEGTYTTGYQPPTDGFSVHDV